ncbi:MAG: Holliday junction branch migration protein RuvA [Gemmatimonadota bacterium]
MIGRIRGRLLSKGPSGVEVLTASGVGYEIAIPVTLADRLPEPGDEVELHTTLVVREDALELYGFATAPDRELFERLQTASGVGPRLALAILGALPGRRIVAAIRTRDHAALQTVSGVGRKTAERITLELADKLDDLGGDELAPLAGDAAAAAAVRALRALGYASSESEEAVRLALQGGGRSRGRAGDPRPSRAAPRVTEAGK